jgi:eukaryotic-like serine/threonine-protein kinase
MKLEPGQVFAERYRIERFLAKGGMGAVFVAMHQLTEMKVALKVLHPEIVASAVARARTV